MQIDNNVLIIAGAITVVVVLVMYMRYYVSITVKDEITTFRKRLYKGMHKQDHDESQEEDSYIDPVDE